MGITIPVSTSITIEEGKHTGKITKIEQRTEPYNYVDIHVTVDDIKDAKGAPVIVKSGQPAVISSGSKLGKLLTFFGLPKQDLQEKGKDVDVEKYLYVGRSVVYMTINEASKDGSLYARIVEGSLKPVV